MRTYDAVLLLIPLISTTIASIVQLILLIIKNKEYKRRIKRMVCEECVKDQCGKTIQDIEMHITGLFNLLRLGMLEKEDYIKKIRSDLRLYEELKLRSGLASLYLEEILKIELEGYLI